MRLYLKFELAKPSLTRYHTTQRHRRPDPSRFQGSGTQTPLHPIEGQTTVQGVSLATYEASVTEILDRLLSTMLADLDQHTEEMEATWETVSQAVVQALAPELLRKLSKSERAGWEWLASKGRARSGDAHARRNRQRHLARHVARRHSAARLGVRGMRARNDLWEDLARLPGSAPRAVRWRRRSPSAFDWGSGQNGRAVLVVGQGQPGGNRDGSDFQVFQGIVEGG